MGLYRKAIGVNSFFEGFEEIWELFLLRSYSPGRAKEFLERDFSMTEIELMVHPSVFLILAVPFEKSSRFIHIHPTDFLIHIPEEWFFRL